VVGRGRAHREEDEEMHAKQGTGRWHRGVPVGAFILALGATAALAAPAAGAMEPPPVKTYLALGDAFAFGYQQERFELNLPNEAPSYFEEGYVNFFARKLRSSRTENNKGLVTINDGCPGETTDSFIGQRALGKSVDAENRPACPYHFKRGFPLHNDLGRFSQLEDALEVLNPCFVRGAVCAPPHEIKAITLNIGANDELEMVARCEDQVFREFQRRGKSKYGKTPEEAFRVCVIGSINKTFTHIATNVETILGLVRSPEFGNYAGSIVFLGYYNPYSLIVSGSDVLQAIFNAVIAKAVSQFGVKYVNPMPAFNPSPEGGMREQKAIGREGLPGKFTEMGNQHQIEVNDSREREVGRPETHAGDIHPTVKGYAELANLIFASYP
jgi:lysophospholipase L1-like esterase